MLVYRLTRKPFADLTGAGGLHVTGRWHGQPAPVIDTSTSRALAMLEVLVHLDVPFPQLPDDYVFQGIDAATDEVEYVEFADLKEGGRAEATAASGSQWLESRRSALLCVPSMVVPRELNVLINPLHPEAASFTSTIETDITWDERLF